MRSLLIGGLTAAVLALTVAFAAMFQAKDADTVELAQLTAENWSRFVPEGKEVDAIYGDYVLRNKYLTAVIAQPTATRHANMTTRDVGGCLIDLTTNDAPSDQLACFYPGKKGVAYRIVGTSSEPKAVGVSVVATGDAGRPTIETDYVLEAGSNSLFVTTMYSNESDKEMTVQVADDFRMDGGKEDVVRSPNGVAEQFWLSDRYWGQSYAVAAGRKLQLNSDARTTQIDYLTDAGDSKVKLAPNKHHVMSRRVYPGRNIFDVRAALAGDNAVSPVRIAVRDAQQRPIPAVRIELFRGEESYGVAMADKDGTLSTRLPPGKYSVRSTLYGNPLGEPHQIEVVTAGTKRADFELVERGYNYGTAVAAIIDDKGQPIPCKVEFKPQDDRVKLDFGPETAEFAVRNLRYTPDGRFTQALPPGKYDIIISHGPEFDAVFTEITIPPNGNVPLTAKLLRTVDTTGWISSDFHSHASPSGDNTASQLGRVLNLVCEHLEFAPCTEHNRVTTYQPHIDRLGIGKFISSVEGMELTGSPLPLNHQNAFPMKYTPGAQDGGGPTTAGNLEEQIERLALWDGRSEKLLQVNHPDIGWMFYDKDGDGKPDAGHERAFPFMDVIEIHPVEFALDLRPVATLNGKPYPNTVFAWLQLLNQGFRIYGVVNTDAHYNFHGSGGLRNWIQSPTDEPSRIQPMHVVHAAEQGRMVMSNGPFLEVWGSETGKSEKVTVGQDLVAKSGKVSLKVRVQCPNWLDVNRVTVLVNGRARPELSFTRDKNPDAFRSTAVKFDRTLDVSLSEDAHIIVITGHPGQTIGKVMSNHKNPPAALSNPIFVDVDGNGFQANKDTLDAPLPVKFETK